MRINNCLPVCMERECNKQSDINKTSLCPLKIEIHLTQRSFIFLLVRVSRMFSVKREFPNPAGTTLFYMLFADVSAYVCFQEE